MNLNNSYSCHISLIPISKFIWAAFLVFINLNILAEESPYQYARIYQSGNSFGYTLKTKVVRNGKLSNESSATSKHHVIKDNNVFYEEVKWISSEDNSEDFSEIAQKFPEYRISLEKNGSLLLPEFKDDLMVGAVTDLNTFYVAMSNKIGISNLNKIGQKYTHKELIKGDWSDDHTNLLGKDCTQVVLTLKNIKQNEVFLNAKFMPPKKPCLDFIQPWMEHTKNGSISNFQMIKKDETINKENVFWGTEYFEINATIDRVSGILKEATMTNKLDLTMKYGCDPAQDNCITQMPMLIERTLTLSLLDQ